MVYPWRIRLFHEFRRIQSIRKWIFHQHLRSLFHQIFFPLRSHALLHEWFSQLCEDRHNVIGIENDLHVLWIPHILEQCQWFTTSTLIQKISEIGHVKFPLYLYSYPLYPSLLIVGNTLEEQVEFFPCKWQISDLFNYLESEPGIHLNSIFQPFQILVTLQCPNKLHCRCVIYLIIRYDFTHSECKGQVCLPRTWKPLE